MQPRNEAEVTARDRRRLADRVRAADRRPRADRPRLGLAEEFASDALVAALEQWPQSGVPDNPGAWLMATAKHRAIDLIRRRATLERKVERLGRMEEREQQLAQADLDADARPTP